MVINLEMKRLLLIQNGDRVVVVVVRAYISNYLYKSCVVDAGGGGGGVWTLGIARSGALALVLDLGQVNYTCTNLRGRLRGRGSRGLCVYIYIFSTC